MSVPTGSKGSGLAIRQPDRLTWDPSRGTVRYRIWSSIDSDDIDVLAAEARSWSQPYTIRSTGTAHTIEIEVVGGEDVTNPADQETLDRWEMPANELQKSIWEHPKLLGVSSRALNASKKAVANDMTYAELAAAEATLWATLSADDKTAIQAAYALAERDSEHYALGQYVLRHVTSVAAGYSANVSDSNVEKLLTTEQLIAEVTDPVLWAAPLPARLQYKIEHLAAPTAKTGYLWSWRKLPSQESTAAGGRIEISTEYWLEQWSTWLYDLAT